METSGKPDLEGGVVGVFFLVLQKDLNHQLPLPFTDDVRLLPGMRKIDGNPVSCKKRATVPALACGQKRDG